MRLFKFCALCLALAPLSAQMKRHVVIIDMDGVRRDLLEDVYLSWRMPQLERLFGSPSGRGFSNALYFENATSVAPTVTMPSQASLITGVYPGTHGIAGNEWFDRDTGKLIDYMSYPGVACVFGYSLLGGSGCNGGRANNDLQVPTLYDWAAQGGQDSLVVYHQYWKGATQVIGPSLTDALVLLLQGGGELDLEAFDRDMMDQAIYAIERDGRPAILTLYFAGADAAGHAQGTAATMNYLSLVIDGLLGKLFDALEQTDPRWMSNTLFLFSADHGRTDAVGTPGDRTALSQMESVLLRTGFDAAQMEIVNQGGLAHVYLRRTSGSWNDSPDTAPLRKAANALSSDSSLAAEVESVCCRDGDYICLPEIGPDRIRLLNAMNSARTGDVEVIARPGRYFGNSKAIGAEHGALDSSDLAVPIILAGGGVAPGRVTDPVSTVQILRTIAEYLGFAARGVEPALPGVKFEFPGVQRKPDR